MSLLLDALKRAEEAKRARLAAEASAPTESAQPSRNPLSTAGDKGEGVRKPQVALEELRIEDYKEVIPNGRMVRESTVPEPREDTDSSAEYSLEMEVVEQAERTVAVHVSGERPSATPAPSRLDAASEDAMRSRDAANTVFLAKQLPSASGHSQKKWLLPVIAAAVVLVGGGAWYVWNEINRMARPLAPNVAARSAVAPAPVSLPAALPAIVQPVAKSPDDIAAKASSIPAELPLPPLLPAPATEIAPPPPEPGRRALVSGPPQSAPETLAKSLKNAPGAIEAPVSIQLSRTIVPSEVNADLAEAYTALTKTEYARARALYARSIQAEPMNVDSQLGMATVLARQGDSAGALVHYRQALALDPRNGTAHAGMLALRNSNSPALEVELRTLIGRNPESSSLHFSLGNLYASERRWVEAQQAYFEAYRLESDNADYVYNLAVSLDHLKQAKLALDYYQKSLARLSKSGGQFDAAAVARRIRGLSSEVSSN